MKKNALARPLLYDCDVQYYSILLVGADLDLILNEFKQISFIGLIGCLNPAINLMMLLWHHSDVGYLFCISSES